MTNTLQDTKSPLPIEPDKSWLQLDDAAIGVHFWAWLMYFILDKWGVDLAEEFKTKSPGQVFADHDVLFRDLPFAALDLDQDDPEGVLLQKAAEFCVKGELARAGKLTRGFIEQREDHIDKTAKVDASNARQRERARNKRPDPYQDLIQSIVNRRPNISVSELFNCLSNETNNGVIESIDDHKIVFLNDNGKQTERAVSGLKDMLYEARKKKKKRAQ